MNGIDRNYVNFLSKSGVKLPTRKKVEPEWHFLLRERKFLYEWSFLEELYTEFLSKQRLHCDTAIWSWCDWISWRRFSKHLVVPPIPESNFRFKTPLEGINALEDAMSLLQDPYKELEKVAYACFKPWFDRVLETRPEGCNVVVIKDPNYQPKPGNEDLFMSEVRLGHSGVISRMSNSYWVAIPITEEGLAEICFSTWAFDIATAIVEYH